MIRRCPTLLLALAGLAACSHKPVLSKPHADGGEPAGTEGGADVAVDLTDVAADLARPAEEHAADDAAPEAPDAGGDAEAGNDAGLRQFPRCGVLSDSLISQCLGCHTLAGPPNPRYPDLYEWTGTMAAFLEKTRAGGGLMPAYRPALISDADIARLFTIFTTTKRPALEDAGDLGSVQPLFLPADAVLPPIVTQRGDGAIVTRGAGRLHARHENEEAFVPYLPSYWDKQSYAFVIEDFSAATAPHFVVTYLPTYTPYKTSWRAWKTFADNSVFQQNLDMPMVISAPNVTSTAPVGGIFQFDETTIPPDRSVMEGGSLEIELGVIKNAGASINPFTDTIRYRIGVGGLTPDSPDRASYFLGGPVPEARNGGDTTIPWLKLARDRAYDQMALDTQQENVQPLLEGRRLFYTDFSTGQNLEAGQAAFPEQAGKAGPRRNASACATCHPKNGSGAKLAGALDATSSMVFRISGAPAVGRQLQLQEGTAEPDVPVTRVVQFSDGTEVTLTRPVFKVTAGGVTPPFSARIAPPLVGLGLLEAIDERTLLMSADPLDCNKDGISGRATFVADPVTGVLRVGRFGWKAEKVSVRHQVADDAAESLGVATSVFPDTDGKAALSDQDLSRLTTWMRLVGVYPQRNATDPDVKAGALLFQTIGCAACHATEALTSPNHPLAELRGQAIRPYTDLLLHDMGPDLMDASGIAASTTADAPASALEWRTPPLWGVGLRGSVNGNAGLLHDGRAPGVQEAILWHGGEAARVRALFMALSADDRNALILFVESL